MIFCNSEFFGVTIETWDPNSKTWLIYRGQEEHSADCEAHPYEKIPKKVFLDTNVVNLLVKNGEQIFEQEPISSDIDKTRAQDIEALMHVFHVGRRASWQLIASHKTINELERTPSVSDREDLLDYALSLVQPPHEDGAFAEEFGRRLAGTHFVSALPDVADQMLIGNAIGYRCDAFCTCDRKTIVKFRDRLHSVPLRILTPLEWWRCVRPWAGLFA
jgi:hypothetical protein